MRSGSEREESQKLEAQLYKAGIITLILGGIAVFLYLRFLVPQYTMPCMVYTTMGFYCPGCGGTRAVEAFLQGRLLRALWFHPLVPYAAVMFFGFMGTHTLEKLHVGRIKGWRFHNWYLWAALGIVAANWILKNILLFGFGITL